MERWAALPLLVWSVLTEVIRLAPPDAADTLSQLSLTRNLPVYYTLVLSTESYRSVGSRPELGIYRGSPWTLGNFIRSMRDA